MGTPPVIGDRRADAYGLPEMLTPKVREAAGEPFRPYRTIVAWWCWRAADTVTL